jgi:hypothetical protein
MPTARSLLWTAYHGGELYECLMVSLRNGQVEVRIVSNRTQVQSRSFDNSADALAWAEEERKVLVGS